MKLPTNLSRAVTSITSNPRGRRADRKAARQAVKEDALKKKIADAQARAKAEVEPLQAELDARILAERRESMLRDKPVVVQEWQQLEELRAQLGELAKANDKRIVDLQCYGESLKGFLGMLEGLETRLKSLEERETLSIEALERLEKRFGEVCITIDEKLTDLEERAVLTTDALQETVGALERTEREIGLLCDRVLKLEEPVK